MMTQQRLNEIKALIAKGWATQEHGKELTDEIDRLKNAYEPTPVQKVAKVGAAILEDIKESPLGTLGGGMLRAAKSVFQPKKKDQ